MSQDKLSTQMPSVERLIQRVIAAEKTNQKEIRITVQEARELVTDLSLLTSKLGKQIQEIHARLDKSRKNMASYESMEQIEPA